MPRARTGAGSRTLEAGHGSCVVSLRDYERIPVNCLSTTRDFLCAGFRFAAALSEGGSFSLSRLRQGGDLSQLGRLRVPASLHFKRLFFLGGRFPVEEFRSQLLEKRAGGLGHGDQMPKRFSIMLPIARHALAPTAMRPPIAPPAKIHMTMFMSYLQERRRFCVAGEVLNNGSLPEHGPTLRACIGGVKGIYGV